MEKEAITKRQAEIKAQAVKSVKFVEHHNKAANVEAAGLGDLIQELLLIPQGEFSKGREGRVSFIVDELNRRWDLVTNALNSKPTSTSKKS